MAPRRCAQQVRQLGIGGYADWNDVTDLRFWYVVCVEQPTFQST